MDAARAAAMSDPDQNHQFRRLWDDTIRRPASRPAHQDADLIEKIAQRLLMDWCRDRSSRRKADEK